MKYDTETRARAVALLLDGNSYTDVETETGVGYNTLKVWKSRFKNSETETVKLKPVTRAPKLETETESNEPWPVSKTVKPKLIETETETGFQKVIYTPPGETVTETLETVAETDGFTWKDAGLIAAVVILCAASILSVGLVLAHAFPVWFGGYMIATVVCTAPVLLLLSKRVTVTIAWVTMILAFVVEVVCNAVAICVKIETETETGILKAVGQLSLETVGNIAFAWLLGLALPALALCFEVLLLKKQEN